MKALHGLFKYVWPQWPRIIALIVCAVTVAVLLSLSFLTIIPLPKVMVDKEEGGIHDWLNTMACRYRYGLTASLPTAIDLPAGQT